KGEGLVLPTTPCDNFQVGVRDINGNAGHLIPGMAREDGTKAFAYGSSTGSFVSLQGDVISINFRLLFSPASTTEHIKLLSFDSSCGGNGVAIAGFGPEFVDTAAQQGNTITFNRTTYEVVMNGVSQTPRPSGVIRYIWLEVVDSYPDATFASYSY